jgi:hypothetical protein
MTSTIIINMVNHRHYNLDKKFSLTLPQHLDTADSTAAHGRRNGTASERTK